ncbi:MAG: hypothetical protein MJ000_02375 [Bacteroidales bacterium]|nr:hypothetical protein [Bacteroidales bacterium]
MTRLFKNSLCAMMTLAIALTAASCKDKKNDDSPVVPPVDPPHETVTCNYSYETSFVASAFSMGKLFPTSADVRSINAYFDEKGIKPLFSTMDYTITEETQEICDSIADIQVHADWEATIAKINTAELQSKLQDKTTFDYYWFRIISDGFESYCDTVGVWSCPINTNFPTYGNFVLGNDELYITRSNMVVDDVQNQIAFTLQTTGGTNRIDVVFGNTVEFPSEQVNVAPDTDIYGEIRCNGNVYKMKGAIKMTKKSDYVYSIEAAGDAIVGNLRPIKFSLNCTDVPF